MHHITQITPVGRRPPVPRPTPADPAAPFTGGEVHVRTADTACDREQAFALRYRVYVEELGYRQMHADHDRRRVEEPVDARADIFIACAGDQVIGTVRSIMGDDGDFGGVAARYGMPQLGAPYPRRVALTGKMIIDPHFRNGRVFLELAHAVFRLGIQRGMLADFIDCEQRLVPMYHRLGYRLTSARPFEHPELGPRMPMRLLAERAYLQSVRSPFLRSFG